MDMDHYLEIIRVVILINYDFNLMSYKNLRF